MHGFYGHAHLPTYLRTRNEYLVTLAAVNIIGQIFAEWLVSNHVNRPVDPFIRSKSGVISLLAPLFVGLFRKTRVRADFDRK